MLIPAAGHSLVLKEVHEAHPGICRMKGSARMYVWWPGIDEEIEKMVRACQKCQAVQSPSPISPWQWPSRPWTHLHLDFAEVVCSWF